MFEHRPDLDFEEFLSEKPIPGEARYWYLNIHCINITALEMLHIENSKR